MFDYLALFGKTLENGGLSESPADGDVRLQVSLVLRRRPGSEPLPSLEELAAIPFGSRRHLSQEEFLRRHGGDAADLAGVRRFAAAYGLAVIDASAEERSCRLSGTVAQMASAFGVDIRSHRVGELTFLAHRECVSLPADLHGIVECVLGLDTFPVGLAAARGGDGDGEGSSLSRRALLLQAAALAPAAALATQLGHTGIHARQTRSAQQHNSVRSEAPHIEAKPQTRFPDLPTYFPPEVAKLYNFPAHLDGSGQCIAIVALGGGYDTTVLQSYFDYLKIPLPKISWVNAGADNDYPNGDSKEIMLDIETAGTVAPGAKIVVYGGTNYVEPLQKALADTTNSPSVISISFSEPEVLMPAAMKAALDGLIAEAATKGVTILNASGDTGSSISSIAVPSIGFVNDLALTNYPGCSPGVLTCGGTTIFSKDGKMVDEVAWNTLGDLFIVAKSPTPPPQPPANLGATGGGASIVYAQPTYQDHAEVPRATNHRSVWRAEAVQSSLQSSSPVPDYGRGVPDVAGHAANYKFLVKGTAPKDLTPLGGTSATTPLWAGLLACINQGLRRRCGFLNPTLYKDLHPGALRQITYGCNGAYQAHPSLHWNACTGLGVPDGTALLKQLERLAHKG
jgi:kumamolisin